MIATTGNPKVEVFEINYLRIHKHFVEKVPLKSEKHIGYFIKRLFAYIILARQLFLE
jgi:hypothetical protein